MLTNTEPKAKYSDSPMRQYLCSKADSTEPGFEDGQGG